MTQIDKDRHIQDASIYSHRVWITQWLLTPVPQTYWCSWWQWYPRCLLNSKSWLNRFDPSDVAADGGTVSPCEAFNGNRNYKLLVDIFVIDVTHQTYLYALTQGQWGKRRKSGHTNSLFNRAKWLCLNQFWLIYSTDDSAVIDRGFLQSIASCCWVT